MKNKITALFLFLSFSPLFAQVVLDTLSSARTSMCSCTLGDQAFFAGGSGTGSDTIDIYDNTTGTWSVHQMTTRKSYPYCRVVNNKAYFISFQGNYGNLVLDHIIDFYDANTNSWGTDTVPLFIAAFGNVDFDVAVHNDQNLVFLDGSFNSSGWPTQLFTLNTNTHSWTADTIPDSLMYYKLAVLGDEALWTSDAYEPVQYLVHYNLLTQTITLDTIPSNISTPELYAGGNKLFIYGGHIPFSAWTSNFFLVYDMPADTFDVQNWTLGGDPEVLQYGNKILFAAGSTYAGSFVSHPGTIVVYDLTNSQTLPLFMSRPRGKYALASSCGNFYLAGGYSFNQNNPIIFRDTIDVFDTITFSRTTGDLTQAKANVSAESINQNLIFAGGSLTSNTNTNRTEIYNCLVIGEEEIMQEATMQVYPNPAQDQVFIETAGIGGAFVLFDVMGKEVLSGQISTGRQTINIASLPNGFYSFRLIDANENVVIKHILVAR
jgi:Secretion system C-terminal sorting domain